MNKLENLKKKILYRASYRGTKEMDLLLRSFVKYNIDLFDIDQLNELKANFPVRFSTGRLHTETRYNVRIPIQCIARSRADALF